MRGRPLSELLSLPVRLHGMTLGRPLDALLDEEAARVIGFELVCGDGAHRFLPWAVADIGAGEIAVHSALALLDERDLAYYRGRTRPLAALGLADPRVDEDGTVHEARTAA
jgi:hypothetical protein